MQNNDYFSKLKQKVNQNLEFLRYFFYHQECPDALSRIRPVTEMECELIQLNQNTAEKFIFESMEISGDERDPSRVFQTIFWNYCEFCLNQQEKPMSVKYFTATLKKHEKDWK
jgi:hypothetical protein